MLLDFCNGRGRGLHGSDLVLLERSIPSWVLLQKAGWEVLAGVFHGSAADQVWVSKSHPQFIPTDEEIGGDRVLKGTRRLPLS